MFQGLNLMLHSQVPHHHLLAMRGTRHGLLLEDICKLDWAALLVKTGREIAKFIVNHGASLAIFRQHSTTQLAMPGRHHRSASDIPIAVKSVMVC